jgi:hypothetical protein
MPTKNVRDIIIIIIIITIIIIIKGTMQVLSYFPMYEYEIHIFLNIRPNTATLPLGKISILPPRNVAKLEDCISLFWGESKIDASI